MQNWIKNYIINWAVQQFTIENLKKILSYVTDWLKVKALETTTPLDDWTLDYVTQIVNDDAKLQVIYDWLKKYVDNAGGICCVNGDDDYKALAMQIEECSCHGINKTISIDQIVALLQLILPVLIEWWQNEKTDN